MTGPSFTDATLHDWLQSLGPIILSIGMMAIAYGAFTTRMDHVEKQLSRLEQVPLLIAEFKTEQTKAMAALRLEDISNNSVLRSTLSAVNQRSQRNYENITSLWEIVRSNQAALRSK